MAHSSLPCQSTYLTVVSLTWQSTSRCHYLIAQSRIAGSVRFINRQLYGTTRSVT